MTLFDGISFQPLACTRKGVIAVAAALPQNASCTDWLGGEANFQINERYLEAYQKIANSTDNYIWQY